MSDQQHIDDLFKQEFENYAPAVPEGTFERIIEERKKRRIAVIWWRDWRNLKLLIIFITAAFVAGGSFLFLNNEKNTPGQSAEISRPANTTIAPVTNKVEKQTIKPVVSGSDSSVASISGDDTPASIAAGKSTAQPQNADKGSVVSNGLSDEIPSASIETASKASGQNAVVKHKNLSGKVSIKTSEIYIETSDAAIQSNKLEPASSVDADQTAARSALNRIPFSLSLITAASLADSNKAIVTNNIKGPDCPEAEKNAAGNKTYWEAYTSADYGNKKYSDTANSLFAAKRKETTSFYSAFSAGVRVTKVFNNGVSIRAGLNFSQINEKFSFVQSNTVQTTYIIDAVTGDTTGSYIVRGTKYKTSFNRYRTLDVPLVIGYEVGNGRLHANFNAGAVINLYSWQKGELLDTAFQPVSITTGKGLPAFQYKTNIGVGFTAAASVYYKLNDRLHLLAEPYFRYNFSPMNKEALSLQERFTTIGLRLGIRIDF